MPMTANASGAAVARYARTQNIDEPLAMLRSGATSYYHADGLGSITSLSNSAGSIANTYTYDSFGKLTASTRSLVNPFQYTARESDTETGLYYYRARYYDSNVGRFASEDPIGFKSDLNLYRYVRNKPINFRDPSGKNSDECASTGNDAAHCRRWQMDCSASAAFVVGVPCYYSCTLIPAATPLLRAAKIGCYLACAAATTFAYYECMERNAPACSKWR